jgi:FkbM family methyltransferase
MITIVESIVKTRMENDMPLGSKRIKIMVGRIAKRNTKGCNCHYVMGAIASSKSKMRLIDPGLGPDAYRVELNEGGLVETFTVDELIQPLDSDPFLIKIDIEGFESNLFESNTDWIDKFPFLVIELHDWMLLNQFGSRNFLVEIGKRRRNFIFRNENIFSF